MALANETMKDRMRAVREAMGLSKRELSAKLNHSPSWVYHIEAGNIRSLDSETIPLVESVLGCSWRWLCNGQGEPPAILKKKEIGNG